MLQLAGPPLASILHASSYLGHVHLLPEPGALGHPCSAPLDVFPGAEVPGLWQREKQGVTVWAQVGPTDVMLPGAPASLEFPLRPPPCQVLSHKAPGAPRPGEDVAGQQATQPQLCLGSLYSPFTGPGRCERKGGPAPGLGQATNHFSFFS